jgi:hypothetical protein
MQLDISEEGGAIVLRKPGLGAALDTSVLVDVLWGDPSFAGSSRRAYRADSQLVELLSDFGIQVVALDLEDGLLAGAVHRQYRAAGGTRRRVLADFLIAAHALNKADRLVARDRGFFRGHFRDLEVWYPVG